MIRVLQVVSSMDRGGLETFIMNVYRNIDRSRVQFDFLVHTKKECAYNEEIRCLGGKIFSVPSRREGIFKNSRELNSFYRGHPEYNIVHMHESCLSYVRPLYCAKKNGIQVRILHSHNTGLSKGEYVHKVLHVLHQKQLQELATDYFACSYEAGNWMFGKDKVEFEYIKNGIESQPFIYNKIVREKYREELGLKDQVVLGHIGRFTFAKNHTFLLDIFYELHKISNQFSLLLIGKGELEEEIHKKACELNIDKKVIFLGERADIPQLLQAMDMIVFPSIYEGLPVTLIEAQAAGLHCIVADTVTKQVNISTLIEYVSLHKSASAWAEIICNSLQYKRVNQLENLKSSGFDIKETAEWIQKFYLTKGKENDCK
jgi:glycosyltransferase involved in cell wall biosynthesis